ncbi:hypothetical protein CORT_0H02130 [Candida orthopsilosis Co 90-125]|uniref:Uncharacterized protein n=1 Tax=Candida orthopsilosis (strain 90-125) TaxID=1136231 RepID=H8XB75_CANO9|nr:hypothetical protein CORT_0H02130 [Candida orthopsilosis Co 90-125]CCG25324.1 hypothetical protein CORT_0H02130 [Candida orthopsilosis Co 90-125]
MRERPTFSNNRELLFNIASTDMNNSTLTESNLLKLPNSTALGSNSTTGVLVLDSKSWILQELSTATLILIFSLTLIVIGSYSTISKPKDAGDPRDDMHSNKNFDPSDMDDSKFFITNKFDLQSIGIQELTWTHVLVFPLVAGLSLSGMYYCIKKNISISSIIKWYFILLTPANTYFTLNTLSTMVVRKVTHLFGKDSRAVFERYRIAIAKDQEVFPLGILQNIDLDEFLDESKNGNTKKEKEEKEEDDVDAKVVKVLKLKQYIEDQKITIFGETDLDSNAFEFDGVFDLKLLLLLPASLLIGYGFYKNCASWKWSNFVAFNFVISSFSQFQLTNFKLAYGLLLGLFFYDIYFVFGTEIMITVATKMDVPMKLSVPKLYESGLSILGLGDIVIPGLLCSLCLRFDVVNYYKKNTNEPFHHLTKYRTPYFTISLIFYSIGILATLVALNVYKVGQPALLYIVPSLLIGVSGYSYAKGEFDQLWSFSDSLKPFDEESGADSDDDEEFVPEDIDDELDEFIAKVERKRAQNELSETDIDDLYIEDDDDTFVIEVGGGEEDSEEDSDDDLDTGNSDEDAVWEFREDLSLLIRDLNDEPREWYTSDEED